MSKKKRRIRTPPAPQRSTRIPPQKAPKYVNVIFSFQYLDSSTRPKKFTFEHKNLKLSTLLDRLRSISQMSFSQFIGDHSSSLRAHQIIWSDTTEPDGFSHLPEGLNIKKGYQVSIGGPVRIIGFILSDVFYVVWIDPTHALYQGK